MDVTGSDLSVYSVSVGVLCGELGHNQTRSRSERFYVGLTDSWGVVFGAGSVRCRADGVPPCGCRLCLPSACQTLLRAAEPDNMNLAPVERTSLRHRVRARVCARALTHLVHFITSTYTLLPMTRLPGPSEAPEASGLVPESL